jgi:methyltransferase-like protein
LALKAREVNQAQEERLEQLALQDFRAELVQEALWVSVVLQALLASQESKDHKASRGQEVQLETLDQQEALGL